MSDWIQILVMLHKYFMMPQHIFMIRLLFTGSQNTVRWCTMSPPEQRKCEAFAKAVERDAFRFEKAYSQLECLQVRLEF